MKRLIRTKVCLMAYVEDVVDDVDVKAAGLQSAHEFARRYASMRVATEPSLVEIRQVETTDWRVTGELEIGQTAPDRPVIAYQMGYGSAYDTHFDMWWVPVVPFPHTHRDDQRYLAIEACRNLAMARPREQRLDVYPYHIELRERLGERLHFEPSMLPVVQPHGWCYRYSGREAVDPANVFATLDDAFVAAVALIGRLRAGEQLVPALEASHAAE